MAKVIGAVAPPTIVAAVPNRNGIECDECRWNYMLQEPEVVGSNPTSAMNCFVIAL